jgi:uncharacterized protein (DUF1800 family)
VLPFAEIIMSAKPILAAALLFFIGASAGAQQQSPELTEHQKAIHVLNRLGFGPRPGDVQRVEKIGVDAYIRQQLHPQSIDDAAAEKAIADLDTLKMSSSHLMDEYFADIRRFLQQQAMSGNAEEMKLRYGIDMSKYRQQPTTQPAANPMVPNLEDLAHRDALRCVGELQQAKLVRAAVSERQLNEVLVDFWSNHFNIDIRKNACRALKVADDRDAIRPHVWGKFRDLLGASAHSPAMLQYLDNNENSVTRERGKVENLVIAMYVQYKLGMSAAGLVPEKEGPNENYGREILELHTLGVDGGYTQKDVQEVARCFSGWSNDGSGRFEFQKNRHDDGQKIVLGQVIAAGGGIKDGEQVLDILASRPSTAKFISRELCQRFVADDPPAELVDRVADVFRNTDGDLRQVVEAIVTSPEFFSPKAYRSKIKSPFEFAVSAVRATDGKFSDEWLKIMKKVRMTTEGVATLGYGGEKLSADKQKSLNWHVYEMGEPLFAYAAPTGYPEQSSKWVNPGALIDRLNFALALTQQQVKDVRIDTKELVGKADADQPLALLDQVSQTLLHGEMSDATRKTLMKNAIPQEMGKTADVNKLVALVLGSPDFQRR